MDNKQKRLERLRVLGGIAGAVGIGLIVLGFREAGVSTVRYIGFQLIGAVLLLLGITPAILYRQQYGESSAAEQNSYSSGAEQVQEDTSWIPVGGWIFADVIGITRNLRADASSGVEYYVICRYRDFKEHVEHTFTSRSMKEYPGKEIIGKRVKVFFHSKDPGDYTVDLNTIE
ncbi:hypothetical protein ACTQ1O_02480 [Bilifractor sp. LCP21S3_A7]|uniref:hypothetical protein n=1 Tax=Bilifractor sp. LCP21S3_A7 TaxID=3438738 RepID=UPI003F92C323